jgi:hypothetical protein
MPHHTYQKITQQHYSLAKPNRQQYSKTKDVDRKYR